MKGDGRYEGQKTFWEFAGEVGYGQAQFANPRVERHIMSKQWDTIVKVSEEMPLERSCRILELGCGDGSFAAQVLAPRFKSVDAFDISQAGIERARRLCKHGNVRYEARDVVNMSYAAGESWDAAFLVGFLHHVKPFAASVVEKLAKVCSRAVVLEPNGDNLIRKALELTPSYKRAGEASFRFKELVTLFGDYGFKPGAVERINLIPPFLPAPLLSAMAPLERVVEACPLLGGLCSTYVLGFTRTGA